MVAEKSSLAQQKAALFSIEGNKSKLSEYNPLLSLSVENNLKPLLGKGFT